MVYVSRSTPYMQKFHNFLLRKQRLAVDAWGKDDKYVKQIYEPISQHIRDIVAKDSYLKLYPFLWSVEERTTRICRTMLLAEFMVQEWADHFRGLEFDQLEELARSFSFENCVEREGLNEALRNHAPVA